MAAVTALAVAIHSGNERAGTVEEIKVRVEMVDPREIGTVPIGVAIHLYHDLVTSGKGETVKV